MFSIDNSLLLIIDIQGRLADVVDDAKLLQEQTVKLIRAFQLLDIPILCTEQVPEKLGSTTPIIKSLLNENSFSEKTAFSCCGEDAFLETLTAFNRQEIIVCGIEAHVCVYQTVFDLLSKKYEIQVVEDAISSRTRLNKNIAIERMKQSGALMTSVEMIICELLKTSQHDQFKNVMNLIK